MNKIQKSLMAVLALFLSLSVVQAQGPGSRGGGPGNLNPEQRAEKQTEAMTEHLGLTAEQVAQVKELNLAFAQKMKENRDKTEADREAIREAMMAGRKEHAEALKSVLTEEQFKKWEEVGNRRGARPDQGRGKGKGKGKGKDRGGKKSKN